MSLARKPRDSLVNVARSDTIGDMENRLQAALDWSRERVSQRKRPRNQRPGVVYVFRCGLYVKIGVAANAHKRLGMLQTGNPHKIVCVCVLCSDAPYDAEQALHNLLSRYLQRGEWFQLPHCLIDSLSGCRRAYEAVRAVRDFMRSEHPR